MRLKLDNVGLVYHQGTPFESSALDGVSLAVEPGERLGIIGPTGSGKSSLLGVLSGVLSPSSGRVMHDGKELTRKSPLVPGSIGLAFQSPENCLFEKTVYDDVAFAPRRLGLDEPALGERVTKALEAVGLDRTRMGSRSPFSLSAGEQRRVALAGVIASEPRALLLDEPTAYLDPATRADLIGRLVRMNEERGMTIVIVSHDMDEMAVFAERIIIIEAGKAVADGAASELLADWELLAGYNLEAPGTVELCRLLGNRTGEWITPALDEDAALAAMLRVLGAEGGRRA